MRHNKHIIRHALLALPARLLAKPAFVELLSDLGNQRVEATRNVLGGLAALAAVAPDVPVLVEATGLAVCADVRRSLAFVVAVVPFADRACDLDVGICADVEGGGRCRGGRGGVRGVVPGVAVAAAEIEQFEGALGACARGYVAGLLLGFSIMYLKV